MSQRLIQYQPPEWAKHLKEIPTHYAQLAMRQTPIYDWKLPQLPEEFKVYLKRDDLTGSTLTGNKIRKLEFILAEAMQTSCQHVITSGSLVSNHCRSTAAACAELGLESHLFLQADVEDPAEVKIDGNMLINTLVGADMYLLPWFANCETEVEPKMDRLAQKIEAESGEKSMIVSVSDRTGLWGYIQCFEEIKQQGVEFDDIVCGCSTGGMLGGLAIANFLNGSPYKVHGIRANTVFNVPTLIDEYLEELGIPGATSAALITLHDEYMGLGYAVSKPEELEFIAQTAVQTGILVDNTYTGKAAYGMVDMMKNKPEVFKGKRILFIHSGGSMALHSERLSGILLPYAKKSQIRKSEPL